MNARELLQQCILQGIRLWPQDGKLRFAGPQQYVTPAFIQILKTQKDLLLRELETVRTYPASYGQQGLWAIHQFAPTSSAYHISMAFHLDGPLDRSILQNVLQLLINRHSALRTRLVSQDGRVVQQVDGHQPVAFAQVAAAAWSESVLQDALVIHHANPFDLAVGPLFRSVLFCHTATQHTLLLTIHHSIVDGWSSNQLANELFTLYQSIQTGVSAHLPLLPQTYADYVAWQAQMLQTEDERLWAYWRGTLPQELPTLHLPTDLVRPPVQALRGISHALELPPALTARLKALARQHGATLYHLLLATYQIWLQRHTGQDTILVGLPMHGRTNAAFDHVVGYFVSQVVVATTVHPGMTVGDVVAHVKARMLGALDHQDYPFLRLVERLKLPRDLSRNPVVQSTFVLQQRFGSHPAVAPTQAPQFGALEVRRIPLSLGAGQEDIALEVTETGDHLGVEFRANAELLLPATLARMAERWLVLVAAIADDAGGGLDRPLAELPIMTAHEQHQILVAWNDTAAAYPQERCVHELFEEQVARTPDAVAVLFEDQQLTYAELNTRANQLAHHLIALGVGPDVLVGMCVERSLEMVVGLLGILKAGGAYVPLDPSYPAERLAFMLNDIAAPVLLTQAHLLPSLPATTAQVVCLDRDWPTIAVQPSTAPASAVQPDHLAYIMYTSGSTGQPKGVCVVHRGIVRLVMNAPYVSLHRDDVFLQLAPVTFDASTFEIWGALLHGARLVVLPPQPPSLSEIGQALRLHQVTILWLTAGLFHLMVDAHLDDLSGLRYLLAGGETLSVPHVRKALAGLGACQLINGYGPTENTTFTCCHPITAQDAARSAIPIGRPIANTQVYILDAHLQPVPLGVAGELYTGGAGLARGYLNRPALTAERFITHPAFGRLYKTGDRACWLPDGNIEFLGRLDAQVKLRGFRIELGEIETVLSRHSAVQTCVLVVREDTPGDRRLVAYVVANEPDADLRGYLQTRLPEYMVPSAFVVLDALPLTSSGKVNRNALPAPDFTAEQRDYVAPRTPSERHLAAIWQAVLKLPRVGLHDNFFALGGDSISSMQIISHAAQRGLALTVKDLFQHQTVATLAQAATAVSGGTPADQDPATGEAPLLPIHHWFFAAQHPEPHHFNQAMMLRVKQPIPADILRAALHTLITHHDALRLRADDGVLTYTPPRPFVSLDLIALGAVPAEERAAQMAQTAEAVQASFDLHMPPLLRAVYFDAGGDDRLLLVIHHLAVDGVSWRVLIEDLTTLLLGGTLPPKTHSYAAWARHLHDVTRAGNFDHDRSYWEATPSLTLPCDGSTNANTLGHSTQHTVTFSATLSARLLHDLPARHKVGIDALLLSALAGTLGTWTGAAAIPIEMESHGRQAEGSDLDLNRTVGWFTSTYPLTVPVIDGQPVQQIRALQERLRQLPHAGLSYGALRHFHPDPAVRAALAAVEPAVGYNYLGQFDQLESAIFALSNDPVGQSVAPSFRRTHLIDLNGVVVNGHLHMFWDVAPQIAPATATGLVSAFQRQVEALLDAVLASDEQFATPEAVTSATVTLQPVPRSQPFPLSLYQEDAYLLRQSATEATIFRTNYVFPYRLGGHLDLPALQQSFNALMQRHEILRTSYVPVADAAPESIVQVVAPHTELVPVLIDLRTLSQAEQATAVERLMEQETTRLLDFTQAPALCVTLAQLGDDEHLLLITVHHINFDGWSTGILQAELSAFYRAFAAGESPSLSPLTIQYGDFAVWQRQFYTPAVLAERQRYWQQLLATPPSRLNFRLAHAQPTGNRALAGRAGSVPLRLAPLLAKQLKQTAQRHQATLPMLLLTAYAIVLARHGGSADLLIGSPTNGRNQPGLAALIGHFSAMSFLRLDLTGTPTLEEALARVKATLVLALSNQDITLRQLLRLTPGDWLPTGLPPAQATFNYTTNIGQSTLKLPGLTFAPLVLARTESPRALAFPITETTLPSGAIRLEGEWIYREDLFDADAIVQMQHDFQIILQAIVDDVQQPIDHIPLSLHASGLSLR